MLMQGVVAGMACAALASSGPGPVTASSIREPVGPNLAQPVLVDGRPLAVPTPEQVAWQDLEIGMFVHIAPQTWQDSETDTMATTLGEIDPAGLDTDQWVRVATSMGAKYLVFVAKHEGGFCWWPTATTDYSVRSIPWRGGQGDVMRDLSASCKRAGIGLGVYLSPQDKKHRAGVGGRVADAAGQREYEAVFRAQLTELLTQYGDVVEVWFDGSLVFDVGDILAAHAPGAMVFQGQQATIRWVGNEDGVVPPGDAWNSVNSGAKAWGTFTAADGDPNGDRWLPNECDARIRSTWFWKSHNEGTLKIAADLMAMYEKSVGRGGVLLLNHAPDRSGLIPEPDVLRAAEFGALIEATYGLACASSSGCGREIVAQPSAPVEIDRIVLMEDITQGERVRAFELDVLVRGEWSTVARGNSIGHKRIERIARASVEAVRLRVTESIGEPIIRRLSLHRTAD
ncbi:MAG: alpha-L-fucosidase [Phycisphaerales bacterium]|nr:alpha-L-fucosidase [Phycisphaerales bacterium]